MRSRVFLATALAAGLAASAAVASPPPGKGKPASTGPTCKPKVTVILSGTLLSDPGTGATSFTMHVTRANKHGKTLAGLDVTITVDAKTKIKRQGSKTVDALALNDRANVRLMRCKGDLPLSASTVDDVAASRVVAHPAISTSSTSSTTSESS